MLQMKHIHTQINKALLDPSTWAAVAAIITAAATIPSPFCWLVIGVAIPGVLLKGGV